MPEWENPLLGPIGHGCLNLPGYVRPLSLREKNSPQSGRRVPRLYRRTYLGASVSGRVLERFFLLWLQ